MAKGRSKHNTASHKTISQRVEQRSPNDQSSGGYDPEDYHAEGPVPVGNAAIHPSTSTAAGILAGVTASAGITGNPGDVPNTGGTSGGESLPSVAAVEAMTSKKSKKESMEGLMNHNQQMQECIENCQQCHAICTETAQHCLEMGGKHAEVAHIRLLLDCAQICQTSADFMLRGSSHHRSTCGICAEVCLACAEECERIGQDDSMMKECAEICRRCAESCRHMSHMKAAA